MTAPMIFWSLAMAVVLFMLEARYGARRHVVWTGVGVTALFGAYLGWCRRTAATFVAPFVSWMVAWFPLMVAAMIHFGFFKGLLAGLFWTTFGWPLIAMIEFSVLFLFATFVNRIRGNPGQRDRDVTVFGPDGSEL